MKLSPSAVCVSDLHKSYGGFEAIRGISFNIEAGETFALLGPNGAGKSTAIEIHEGYRDRTAGEVSALGVDPQRGGLAWKSRLGIVLQSTGESGNVTVTEQLTHFAGLYPQPRRVDVALGIIGRPDLLFLDEPTTGFDPEARHQFWDLVRRLKADGTTILLTTHYLDEAAQLGDRAGVINDGLLIDIGAINEIGGADAWVPLVRWREPSGVLREKTHTGTGAPRGRARGGIRCRAGRA